MNLLFISNYSYFSLFFYWSILLIKIICISISVAFFTIAERKVMAAIQRRIGPNIEGGPFGLIQPIADGLKLFTKEFIIPSNTNYWIFLLAPLLIFILSLINWSIIPFGITNTYKLELELYTSFYYITVFENWMIADNHYGILLILAVSSLNVYGIILGGWASNSKYAFLGSLRSAAQMISYEVSIGLVILPVIIFTKSFNLTDIVLMQEKTIFYIFPLFPCFIIFFISMLAETNRAPFDLPEAEAELVAGYNVEYGSMAFALFFLGEYSNMLFMSALITILFCGGWLLPIHNSFIILFPFIFSLKIIFFCFSFILVRATFPRYRYDQLMDIGWKIFLPISLSFLILITSFSLIFDILPKNIF